MARALPAVSLALGLVCVASVALAYIGPGAGLSIVGSIVAVLAAVVVGLVGFVWYPVRRLLKKRRTAAAKADTGVPREQQ